MLELKRLNEEKATRTIAMRNLLDNAKKEGRDLNRSENKEWSILSKEVDDYNSKIEAMEKNARADAANLSTVRVNSYNEERWVDTRSGREIQVLNKSDRFTDSLSHDERGGSLGRYIQATVTGDWRNAEFEQRALSSAPGSAGVAVPFSLMANILDQARSKSVLMAAGAKSIKMDSNSLVVAKVASDPSFQFKAENELFTGSDMTFGKVELNAFTLGTVVSMSRELAADAPNAVQMIEKVIAEAIAAEIDRVGLFGTGINQPLGLMNQAIQEVPVNGGLVDYNKFVEAWVKILEANGTPNAYVVCPHTAGVMEQYVSSEAGVYLTPPQAIAQLQRHISSKIPNDVAVMGDFTQALFGIRQGFLLEATTQGGETFERHQLKLKLTWRGDFAVTESTHFTKLTGITA
jgi:HK97 family phage major capsid protein